MRKAKSLWRRKEKCILHECLFQSQKRRGKKKKSFNNILDKTFIKKKKISITEVAKISSSAFKEKN